MTAPLIGITGRRLLAAQLAGSPAPMLDAAVDVHFAEYADKIAEAGGVPVQLSRSSDARAVVDRLDGLVLAGGADIDPRRYGATPGPGQGRYEVERDRFEDTLLAAAVQRRLAVLGICRGAQLINVHFGGTLIAHLAPDSGEGHSSTAYPRHVRSHAVTISPGSLLESLYGSSIEVNSFHHQAVDRLGDGLTVSAVAADGVIEAIEHQTADILGVQWHPEMLPGVEPCFDWIVRRAKEHL